MYITGVIPQSQWQQAAKTKYCQFQDCGATFGLFGTKTNCHRCGIVLCSKCTWQCKSIPGHYNDKTRPVCPRCMENIEKQKFKLSRNTVNHTPPQNTAKINNNSTQSEVTSATATSTKPQYYNENHVGMLSDLQSRLDAMTQERDALQHSDADHVGMLSDLQSRLDAMTQERDALQHSDADHVGMLSDLQSRLDAMTQERDALQHSDADHVGMLSDLQSRLGAMIEMMKLFVSGEKCDSDVVGNLFVDVSYSVGRVEKRPLEVVASSGLNDDLSCITSLFVVAVEGLKEREMVYEKRMTNLRLKERKLLSVVREIRAKYDEYKECERRLKCSVRADSSCSNLFCSLSPLPVADVSDEVHDVLPLATEDVLQKQLLHATEAYRDVVYQHIVDSAGGVLGVNMAGKHCLAGETPVEKTERMLSELEQLFGGLKSGDEKVGCVRGLSVGSFTSSSERCLTAFRRLEKAVKALT